MNAHEIETARVLSDEFARRLRALLGPGGITRGFPKRERDRWILMHAVARTFPAGRTFTEIEATQRIGGFLMQWAPHWEMDRVTIRRELVDGGFLDRDSDGRNYRRSTRHESRIAFDDAPELDKILG